MTLGEALGATARAVPDRTALVATDRRLTYREFDGEVSRLAAGLRRLGLSQGDSVVLLLPSGWEALRGLFAVARAGGVAVPVNPALKSRELAFVLDDVLPALVLAVSRIPGNDLGASLVELQRSSSWPGELVFAGPDPPKGARRLGEVVVAAGEPVETVDADIEPDDLAAIFYTTGTTGTPKGVLHTHRGLIDSFLGMEELYTRFFSGSPAATAKRVATLLWRYRGRLLQGIGPQTWTTPLPLHSIAGFRVALNALLGGHRMALTERFHPRGELELIERERVSILAASPSMVEAMLSVADLQRYDLSSLLVVGLGAAPAGAELVRRARAAFGCAVVVGYGSTETGGGVLVTRLEDPERQLNESVGRPFPGTEVRIVDEQRLEVADGTVGELACRVPGQMAGYLGNDGATTEVVDEQGWYYTGDLATMDPQGYVRIVGRKRDLIIRGGQNIVPAEVERVLLEHAAVGRATVVGVPDRLAGETIWAFVVAAERATLDLADLRAHCAQRMEPSKQPDELRVCADLPTADSGEIRKTELRELALAEIWQRRGTRPVAAD
jgi:fatty-acyl-CoA synthase